MITLNTQETIDKLFAPREIALSLKEIEFDEPCISHFRGEDSEPTSQMHHEFKTETNSEMGDDTNYWLARPLYQQIIDWFENNHNILIHRVAGFTKGHICYKVQDVIQSINIDTLQGENSLNDSIIRAIQIIQNRSK